MMNLYKKWWFKWLIAGVLVRLLLMPITLHPDLWVFSSSGYFLAYEGKLNIYEHLANLPASHPLVKSFGNVNEYFIYPPLAHITFGIFQILLKPFIDSSFIPDFWSNPDAIYSNPALFKHLFLFKLPYLFIDIILAFLLASFFEKPSQKRLAFILWMFNPLALYTTFMMGQFDLLPTFFIILALTLAKKKKYGWSLISLGIGGSIKMYPLLFVIVAAILFGKNIREKLKYLSLGFLPFLLTIAPYITSPAFRQMVLFSPKNQKMLFMGFAVSGAEVLYPFIIILFLIYFHAYYSKTKYNLEEYFLWILLLMFSVTHYHPQWFLWITPFLIIYLIKSNFQFALLVISLFVSWLIITLFFEASLTYGLFNPILPSLKNGVSVSEIVSKYTDVFQLKSIVRSYFAAASIFLVYSMSKHNQKVAS